MVDCVQTWKRICEASRNEFDAIYKRLDVRLLWRGESFYNPMLRPLVEELEERGIAEESDGALVNFPALVYCYRLGVRLACSEQELTVRGM